MKASRLITYLENEIRKHGDREVRIFVAPSHYDVTSFTQFSIITINEETKIIQA